jgi:hypothetical protein
MTRRLKQFIYGGILILIIGVMVLVINKNSLFTKPTCFDGIKNQGEEGIDCGAVCGISCEQKYLKDLSYSNAKIIQLNDVVSVYFDLINSNPNYGAKDFKYQVDIYGFANKLLKTVNGESFIYPGEKKKIVEAGIRILGKAESVKISFSNVNWQPSSVFRSIRLENVNAKVSKEKDFFVISGTIRNSYNFVIPKTVINGFLMDKDGNVLGVSKTEIDELQPFEAGEQTYKILIKTSSDLEDSVDFSNPLTYIYPIY